MSYPVDAPQGPCDQNGIPIWHCQAKMPDGSECGNRCEVAISQSEKNNGKMYHKCNVKDPVTNEYHNFRKWTTDLQEKKSWGNSMMPARNVPNSGQSAQTVHTQSAQVAQAAQSLSEILKKTRIELAPEQQDMIDGVTQRLATYRSGIERISALLSRRAEIVERQQPALVLRRVHEEHEHDAEREDVDERVASEDLLIAASGAILRGNGNDSHSAHAAREEWRRSREARATPLDRPRAQCVTDEAAG